VTVPPCRSFLYVPGDRPDRVAKAFASAADAVIVDLEDSVRPDSKVAARDVLRSVAAHRPGAAELWVRINAGAEGVVDLDLLSATDGIDGVVVAKCETTDWLDRVASAVSVGTAIAALIESARGMHDVAALAGHVAVSRCHLGEVDLLADLGGRLPGGHSLIDAARVALVVASAAAAIDPPVGGVHLEIDDLVALTSSSTTMADLGFGGRAVVHPSHVAAVNEAFAPSAADIAWATDVLARWAGGGAGALRGADGSMIDEAVVRRARRLVPG
jgi:citrate lyase subunit beta / citryl-CoA lyase